MKTVQYLDAVKGKLGIHSDYALAKALGVPRQTISNYMIGRRKLDTLRAARVAELLGIDPLKVIADCELERAATPAEQAVWREIARKAAAIAAVAIAWLMLTRYAGADLTIPELLGAFSPIGVALNTHCAIAAAMLAILFAQRGRWWPEHL